MKFKEDIYTKLKILSKSAEFDNVCTGSGKKRETKAYTKGLNGISYVWLSNGKCLPLLKILYTNFCINNCKYCYNRRKNDIRRTAFTPEEIANLTLELYKKGYIKGLFLSSGIYRSPDDTMELMIRAVELLRKVYNFKAYIHLKILPGTSKELIKKAIFLANRVSCNIELPTQESLKKLAPEKEQKILIETLAKIRTLKDEFEKKTSSSTQLIIGATPDTDKTILKLSQSLYKKGLVKRVYYSAYIPINNDKDLPFFEKPPYLREYRLYQADFLLRFYGFSLEELFINNETLDLKMDPKLRWALSHPEFFPIDITKADYWELLRIPGIGPLSAKKIIEIRKYNVLNEDTLKKLKIPLKKAKYFIAIKGKPLYKSFKEFTFIFPSLEKSFRVSQLSLF